MWLWTSDGRKDIHSISNDVIFTHIRICEVHLPTALTVHSLFDHSSSHENSEFQTTCSSVLPNKHLTWFLIWYSSTSKFRTSSSISSSTSRKQLQNFFIPVLPDVPSLLLHRPPEVVNLVYSSFKLRSDLGFGETFLNRLSPWSSKKWPICLPPPPWKNQKIKIAKIQRVINLVCLTSNTNIFAVSD